MNISLLTPLRGLNYIEDKQDKKTPYKKFLEDDGPYLRKLYGPIQHSDQERENKSHDKHMIKNQVRLHC